MVVNMIPRLRALGAEVDLCVFDGTDTPLMQRAETLGCRIYKFGQGVYNPVYVWKLFRLMRKYDIVHTHNTAPQLFAALGSVLCSVVTGRSGARLVTTEHNTSNRRRAWRWYRPVDRWMYNQYIKVVCISLQAEANLRQAVPSCKAEIQTVFNGVDVEAFHRAQPLPSLRQGDSASRFVVTMVAGFRYQKDQDTLIRTMALLPGGEFELWLVGEGERRQLLETLVREQGVEDRVHFLGLRTDIPEVLKSSDAVVMSSHFEGLSLSSIEGMSVDKPFIASDVDGLREITDGYGILFPHGDAEALASILCRLKEDRDYYNEVAAKCYERARQYDISKTVKEYLAIYHELKE